jgi:hypothetical protein
MLTPPLPATPLRRRQRMMGYDTFFLTGTDEHGQKIERAAQAAGKTPQQFADDVSAQFRALWNRMGITYDDYIRTTEDVTRSVPQNCSSVSATTIYLQGQLQRPVLRLGRNVCGSRPGRTLSGVWTHYRNHSGRKLFLQAFGVSGQALKTFTPISQISSAPKHAAMK